MIQALWIPGRLPGLNDIIGAHAMSSQNGKFRISQYDKMKKKWGETVTLLARSQSFQRIGSAHFAYLFREPDRRRDPSNFIAGGVKIIEDGLQEAGLLSNDGWKNVGSIRPYWLKDADRYGVTLFVSDYSLTELQTCKLEEGRSKYGNQDLSRFIDD